MSETGVTTLTTFTASDGENLAVQDWPLSSSRRARATILLVHGLGEHVGRYDALARRLNDWGFAVRGYDQYGHGDSSGPRGGLTSENRLLDDLADLVDATRARMPADQPLLLLGHSMGGLVASLFVAQKMRPVQGLLLSSPALAVWLNPLQKAMLSVLPRMAPHLRMGNGLSADDLSHDPAVVAAYRADPRCHDRLSAGLARFVVNKGQNVIARATRWDVPTLLMWAGDDHCVNPAGSQAFAAAAPAGVVAAQGFEGLYHELLNETPTLAAPVFDRMQLWLRRYP